MKFNLKIVTPNQKYVDLEVDNVMLAGVDGYFTLFAGHSPFVSKLKISSGYYTIDNKMYPFTIKGGFATMLNAECDVITSLCVIENFVKSEEVYANNEKLSKLSHDEIEEYFTHEF